MTPADFEFLAAFLQRRSGLALTPDKAYLLDSRLAPVARRFDLPDVAALVQRLRGRQEPALVDQIVDAMTTNESFFFRDGKPFQQFTEVILPALVAGRRSSKRISIWCAAASTGQEPYSLAMCLDDMKHLLQGYTVDILATDISPTALGRAREARYSQFEVQRGLPVRRLVDCFEQDGDGWIVRPHLRNRVRFQHYNLLDLKQSFGRFDVIFCRNVLIYFDLPTKQRVVDTMAGMVPTDGFFLLGGTETILGVSDRFRAVDSQRGLYRPVDAASGVPAARTVAPVASVS